MTVTRKVTRIARHVKRRDAVSDDRQRGWFAATGSIRARCQHSQLELGNDDAFPRKHIKATRGNVITERDPEPKRNTQKYM